MACGVKKIAPSRLLRLARPAGLALVLAACSPGHPEKAEDPDAYMHAQGYASAPQITSVAAGAAGMIAITGKALPGARVRIQYDGGHNAGITADSRGGYRADLPLPAQGALYDISTEDSGRQMPAEGRLFVPSSAPAKAVILRAGLPGRMLGDETESLAVMDFDGGGALVLSGKVAPKTEVTLDVDNQGTASVVSDARGGYYLQVKVSPPAEGTTMSLSLVAGGVNVRKVLPFANAASGDRITPVDGGWRVDWAVPGGGMQTTVVY